jgi:iron complex outermembrane receptor protein
MRKFQGHLWLCASLGAMLAGTAGQVQAQAADNANGDIIVTAQKREQDLQDVPVSVSVLSSAALANNRVAGIEQLAQIAPSVNFTNSANTRGRAFRCAASARSTSPTGSSLRFPQWSTVVISRSAAAFFDFSDLDRVEVLRGPQGTLFGKNASAGVINVVTEKPDLSANHLDASVSYGTFNDLRLKASASAVLDPGRLALRISGYRSTADGIITNLYNGQKLNNTNSWGLRGKLLWEPGCRHLGLSDRRLCQERPQLLCFHVRSVLPTTTYYNGQTARSCGRPRRWARSTAPSIDGGHRQPERGRRLARGRHEDLGPDADLDHRLAFFDYDNNDTDGVQVNVYNINNARQHQKQFTQELRLPPRAPAAGICAGPVLFWQDLATTTQTAGTGNQVLPAGAFLGSQVDRGIKNNNGAAFGQLTFHATPALSLIGGFRLTTESADANFARTAS